MFGGFYAPSRLYQLKTTSPKKPTPRAATPRNVPKGSSYVDASLPVNQM